MRFDRYFRTIPLRFRSLLKKRLVERDLDEEVQYHVDRQIEVYTENGLTPDEARTAAMRHFGGMEQCKEECRDARRVSFIEDAARDLRFGWRWLRQNVGFAFAAVATLALGVGA